MTVVAAGTRKIDLIYQKKLCGSACKWWRDVLFQTKHCAVTLDCINRMKKKEKQGLEKIHIERKCKTLPFFWLSRYELEMSAHILLHNTSPFWCCWHIPKCEKIVGRSVLDKCQKNWDQNPAVTWRPALQQILHQSEIWSRKGGKWATNGSINQTSLLETTRTSYSH